MAASPPAEPVSHHSGLAGEPQKHHNGAEIGKELGAVRLRDSLLPVGLKECERALGKHSSWGRGAWPAPSQGISWMPAEQESVDSRRGLEAPRKQEGAWPHAGHKLFLRQHWLWTAPTFPLSVEKSRRADLLPPGFPACCMKCKG